MRVKVGDKWYDGKEEPVMVELTDSDKENIANMAEDATKYCNYPDWMVMCDPDCLIRGELNFSEDGKILGTRINCCLCWSEAIPYL